jgi:hypothetical protein
VRHSCCIRSDLMTVTSAVRTTQHILHRPPRVCGRCPDTSKRRAYQQVSSALPFVPVSVESFERLVAPALTLLGDLADRLVLAGLASLGPPSSQGRSGSLALSFAGATRPCVGRVGRVHCADAGVWPGPVAWPLFPSSDVA